MMEMKSGTVILDDSLLVSYKTKHTLTLKSSNCTLWYLPKGAENLCSIQKPTHLLQLYS